MLFYIAFLNYLCFVYVYYVLYGIDVSVLFIICTRKQQIKCAGLRTMYKKINKKLGNLSFWLIFSYTTTINSN